MPLSFRDVDQILRVSDLRDPEMRSSDNTTGSSSGTAGIAYLPQTLQPTPTQPSGARRRKSLADLLSTFKAKLVRDRSSSEDSSATEPSSIEKVMSSSTLESRDEVRLPNWVPLCDPPPRLEVLDGLPQSNLKRTSTFRDSLEKAAVDINNRYGTIQSLPDSTRLRRRPSLHQPKSNYEQCIPIPPRSYFRPRDPPDLIAIPLPNPLDVTKVEAVKPPLYRSVGIQSCRRHGMGSRVPAAYVDKVLEESLPMRLVSAGGKE